MDMTDGVRNVQKASSNVSPLLQSSREAFKNINNISMLVAIFWDKIAWQINDWLSTDMALNVYETSVLDWKEWLEGSIDTLIETNRWEVKYNFIRVRERLGELKVVFEEEIVPIYEMWHRFDKVYSSFYEKNGWEKEIPDSLNKLTQELIKAKLI